MSNLLVKAHIAYGRPCGDAGLDELEDWAGAILLQHKQSQQSQQASPTTRDVIAAAVFEEVNAETVSIRTVCETLGVQEKDYDNHKHWTQYVAVRCFAIADAFMEARLR